MSEKEKEIESKNEESTSRMSKPLVFISHDTRDAELAEAFSKLLSSVSAGVLKSFRSSDKKGNQGIAYGIEWYPAIMEKLDEASDVVALLTQHSVNRPWILYEAGVAKGKLDTPLLGIAIGIPLNKANNGPFAQFQNSGDDIDSLTKLVVQLVRRIPNAEPDQDVIRIQVEAFKSKAKEILEKQPEEASESNELMEDSSVAKLFEEIKIMFQDLPERIEHGTKYRNKHRRFRLSPKMLHGFSREMKSTGIPYMGFLVLISLYKDEMPWVYEIGRETYDNLKKAKTKEAKEKAISGFGLMIKESLHHPIFRDMMNSKENYRMVEELMYLGSEYLANIINE